MSVTLKINLPDRSLKEEKAAKIVLPVQNGTLTVIEDRAPTMQMLEAGVVRLLDDQNQTVKRWFINGGIADIASDYCKIAVEEAVDLAEISPEIAAQKASENAFYRQLDAYLRAFG